MAAKLPGWAINDEEAEIRAAELREMTPDQRLARFAQACALSTAILQSRSDALDVLASEEPLSPESEALWLRLVAEARRGQAA